MSISLLDRFPTAQIEARAQTIDVRKAAVGLLTLPFVVVGFVAAVGFTVLRWSMAATLEGWDAGRAATTRRGG